MKRLGLAAFGCFLGFGSLFAQNAYDALNVSREDPILGTARYSAMGGAFGAFGANASTMKDNPAGLGVYSKWDLSLTPNVYVTNDNSVDLCLNNFGLVINFGNSGNRSGYVSSSFGIAYNRLKNFDRFSDVRAKNLESSMTDFMRDGASDPVFWEAVDLELVKKNEESGEYASAYSPDANISSRVRFDESGSTDEWNLSYGMNISNRIYWGVGLGFTSLDYTQETKYDEMSPNDGAWYLDNYCELSGSGVNVNLGVIARLTDFMRVGVAFHSPTFYTIDQVSSQRMGFDYVDEGREISSTVLSYDLQTPLKLQGSLGFVFGKRAILGLEYQYMDYSAMRITDVTGDVFMYNENNKWTLYDVDFDKTEEKSRINNTMTASHTIKAGAEINVVKNIAVRFGTAYVTKPVNDEVRSQYTDFPVSLPEETLYFTTGFGYKAKIFYVDAAFVYKTQANILYDYLPADVAYSDESLNNLNIMASVGWKF